MFMYIEVSLFDPNNREPVPGVVPKTFSIKVRCILICTHTHTHMHTHTHTRTHTHTHTHTHVHIQAL